MYFIELVTTEHKLGITISSKKKIKKNRKSGPKEKWKQSAFNIPYFSFSAPLPHLPSLSLPCSLRMHPETEQHCFYILLSRGFPCPSHPSTQFTFLPVKPSRSRCCYLPSFQQPVTSVSFSFLQKPSLSTFSMRFPAVPDTCWEAQSVMSNFGQGVYIILQSDHHKS